MLPLEGTREYRHLLADLMDEAARLIEEHGWVRGYFGTESEGFCLAGAVHEAAYRYCADMYGSRLAAWSSGAVTLRHVALGEIGRQLAESAMVSSDPSLGQWLSASAICWNDAPERTRNDVITQLQKTAIDLRSQV